MTKTLTLREANQGFARHVKAVETGEEFVITRNGKPVARLTPIEPVQGQLTAPQAAALERLRARWKAGGWKLHAGPLNRESLYER